MRVLDLFSGLGGFSIAARWMGWETIGFSEVDPYCCKVLAKNFPGVKNYGDIRNMDGRTITADLITGGFPCQSFSLAGKRKGTEDDRYLWPQMFRVIAEANPSYIVAENVPGIINVALEHVCLDLESLGYEVAPVVIPACAVGAPHRRDRVWILGCRKSINHANDNERKEVLNRQRGLRQSITSQMEILSLHTDENWGPEEPKDDTAAQISDERSARNGRRPHQPRPPGQSQDQSSYRPTLREYAQQEDAGWSAFAERQDEVEGNYLRQQRENLVRTIRYRTGSQKCLRASTGEIWTQHSTDALYHPINGCGQGRQGRLTTGSEREPEQALHTLAHTNRNNGTTWGFTTRQETSVELGLGGSGETTAEPTSQQVGIARQSRVNGSVEYLTADPSQFIRDERFSRDGTQEDGKTRLRVKVGTSSGRLAQSEFRGGHDGLPAELDRIRRGWADGSWCNGISPLAIGIKHRADRLRALGNAIVPAIAFEIFRALEGQCL